MKAPLSEKVTRARRGDLGCSIGEAGPGLQAKGPLEKFQGKECHHLSCVPCRALEWDREGLPREVGVEGGWSFTKH